MVRHPDASVWHHAVTMHIAASPTQNIFRFARISPNRRSRKNFLFHFQPLKKKFAPKRQRKREMANKQNLDLTHVTTRKWVVIRDGNVLYTKCYMTKCVLPTFRLDGKKCGRSRKNGPSVRDTTIDSGAAYAMTVNTGMTKSQPWRETMRE